jgi:hypothetical protein
MGPRVIDDLVIGMAGSGGDGIVSAGESLISACAAIGYHAMMTKSFGSQIRGGESSCRVRLATGPVLNPGGALDVAVVLDWDDFLKFGAELPVAGDTVVLYEAGTNVAPTALPFAGVAPAEAVPHRGHRARGRPAATKARAAWCSVCWRAGSASAATPSGGHSARSSRTRMNGWSRPTNRRSPRRGVRRGPSCNRPAHRPP